LPAPLTFKDYSARASATAIYPGKGEVLGLLYCGLGAANEAGEVAGKIKKMLRDDHMLLTDKRRVAIRQEVGGTLWYLSQVCKEIGCTLEEAAAENLDVLAGRQERGTLHGDGDVR
jgi:NTP pyrophosphatase (non-canonical NTP hydrolase)